MREAIALIPARLRGFLGDVQARSDDYQRALDKLAKAQSRITALQSEVADQRLRIESLERALDAANNELQAVTHSLSWRITRPLRMLATGARAALNRSGVRVPPLGLVPSTGIETIAPDRYRAWGDHWFVIHAPPHELPRGWGPGWYAVRLHGLRSAGVLAPALYVDYGSGLSEQTMIRLPSEVTQGRRAFVHLRRRTRVLRLDPSERPGEFELGGFEMRRVPSVVAMVAVAVPLLRQALGSREAFAGKLKGLVRTWRKGGLRAVFSRVQEVTVQRRDYGYWVQCYDTPTQEVLAQFAAANDRLVAKPLISVLVPVYNTPERWLRLCVESVITQTYPHWELCIADDASTDPSTARVLAELASADARIRIVRRSTNGHISAASNSALEVATGDVVALLDHDDALAPTALYWIADSFARHPDAVMVYSDEDKVNEAGDRFDPYFKPDWNVELVRAQNYINHLTAYRRDAVLAAGGFRIGFEGSQDWDLMLRVTDRCDARQIVHVPRVLYHWRTVSGSTALSQGAKTYAMDAGTRAVRESLARRGIGAEVEKTPDGYQRVSYALPDPSPLVSIMIPTRNSKALVEMCIESLMSRTTYRNYEILLVDNQSDDPDALAYFAALERRPQVRVLRYDAPFNFSAINNFAADAANGNILLLLNNDIEVIDGDWLAELVRHAARPENGAVGAKLLYPDTTIQHAGVIVGYGGVAGHIAGHQPRDFPGQMSRCRLAQNLTAVTAACLAVRKDVYKAAGGMDETSLRIAFNDIDLCLRIAALGYRNVWTPYAELVHHESATRGYEDTPEKKERFAREVRFMIAKWGETLLNDPAYNPNLDLEREPFGLAYPPRLALLPEGAGSAGSTVIGFGKPTLSPSSGGPSTKTLK